MATAKTLLQVVPFPQLSVPPKEPITQLELDILLSLKNRLAQLQAQVETEEMALRGRLEAGAIVEPGVHVAELKESFRRNVAWKAVTIRLAERLKLDGESYCARVLGATKPTRTVSLQVS